MANTLLRTDTQDTAQLKQLGTRLHDGLLRPLVKDGNAPIVCVYGPTEHVMHAVGPASDAHVIDQATNDPHFGFLYHLNPSPDQLEKADIVIVVAARHDKPLIPSRSFARSCAPRSWSEIYFADVEYELTGPQSYSRPSLLQRLHGLPRKTTSSVDHIVGEMRRLRKIIATHTAQPNDTTHMVSIILANPNRAYTQAFKRFSSSLST